MKLRNPRTIDARQIRPPRDFDARLKWSYEFWKMHATNARMLEKSLDQDLAKVPTWSKEWWSIVEQMDRVRKDLIELEALK